LSVLETRGLGKTYPVRSGVLARRRLVAAEDVNLEIGPGETLALVGESGSGKSTVGKCVLRLEEPSSGEVLLDGTSITGLPAARMRALRRDAQIVFQDPLDSLNPRHTVGQLVAEPVWLHGVATKRGARAEVERLFDVVGLSKGHVDRLPHQLSGGQQQRVGIARALATSPKLVVLDEPTSALDVSVQAQIVTLLRDLQEERGLAYLFITHDLAVVSFIAHRIAVMYLGQIVETGPKRELLERPFHPYTRGLIAAAPVDHPDQQKERIVVRGEPVSPIDPPAHCRLVPRCPFARPICSQVPADLLDVQPGRATRCVRFQREHRNGVWEPRPERGTDDPDQEDAMNSLPTDHA
jgi:oligopeptide/dipeptide ABC transporter ATP-binding protein